MNGIDYSSIDIGSLENPYKEFTYTIPASGIIDVFYAFNYFRVLSFAGTASDIKIRFGASGQESDLVGAGIGIELPQPIQRVSLRNTTGSPLNITFALAIGKITDDRLNVSGSITTADCKAEGSTHVNGDIGNFILGVRNDSLNTGVTTANNEYSPISVDNKGALFVKPSNNVFTTGQTLVSTVAVLIITGNIAHGEILISAGASDLYIGNTAGVTTANGFLIPAGSTLGLNGNMGNFYGIRASGSDTVYTLRGIN